MESNSIKKDNYYISIGNKVQATDGSKTYVLPFPAGDCMTIATGVASQFIFDILISLILISTSPNRSVL
jgi:hypothetical protein